MIGGHAGQFEYRSFFGFRVVEMTIDVPPSTQLRIRLSLMA